MQHPGGTDILSINDLSRFRFSKPDDIRRLEREQQELSWSLDGRSQFDGERLFGEDMPSRLQGGTAPDQDHLRTLMGKNQATLEATRPPQGLSPLQRNKYAALERDLREKIQQGMLSTDMENDPSESNVERELAWQHYHGREAIAWMNVRQLLDPTNDSPFFTSIEALRPSSPPTVDLRKLRMNWDNVQFTSELERQEVVLDESVYQSFLKLKALDWSDKGIMRELGLSRAGLEVACARLLADRQERQEPPDEETGYEDESTAFGDPMFTPDGNLIPRQAAVAALHTNGTQEPPRGPGRPLNVPRGTTSYSKELEVLLPFLPEWGLGARDKAKWLRNDLRQRHIAVTTLAKAMGLGPRQSQALQTRISRNQNLSQKEWIAVGRVMQQIAEDPNWILQYDNPKAWLMAQMHMKTDEESLERRWMENQPAAPEEEPVATS